MARRSKERKEITGWGKMETAWERGYVGRVRNFLVQKEEPKEQKYFAAYSFFLPENFLPDEKYFQLFWFFSVEKKFY